MKIRGVSRLERVYKVPSIKSYGSHLREGEKVSYSCQDIHSSSIAAGLNVPTTPEFDLLILNFTIYKAAEVETEAGYEKGKLMPMASASHLRQRQVSF